jgi:4-hydroxy-3-polyprenylbenzoate decarboxylase
MENVKWKKDWMENFPEIKFLNDSLLKHDIPVLIISVEKNRRGHIRELHQSITSLPDLRVLSLCCL